jgi:peptidoglycan hydrolase-like protein with peptidoglycan-binding domain
MTILKIGSRGDDVLDLQQDLAALSIECDDDGIFGPLTDRAVKHFQTAYGLEADGVAGPKTLALLQAEVEKIEGGGGGGGDAG